jgi:subtilisin family serine protease
MHIALILLFLCQTIGSSFQTENKLSKHWLMKMSVNDVTIANQLAKEHNFKLVRQVGQLKGYFMILSDHSKSKRSLMTNTSLALENLSQHPLIESIHKEELIVREKRDFIEMPSSVKSIDKSLLGNHVNRQTGLDPSWADMWFLNRHLAHPDLPDMNVTGAWTLGYTGRGVSVTFLDDGLEWTHPDIIQNYDSRASVDLNDNDMDPTPRYDETDENKHGTRCAGEVAGKCQN